MAESLEQAYELNQKKRNCIIGGMLWLKMGSRMVPTAIDLSNLGLNTIEENEEEFSIGCMTTLRQLEQHEGLNSYIWLLGCTDLFSGTGYLGGTVQRRLHPTCRICQAETGSGYSGAPDCEKT